MSRLKALLRVSGPSTHNTQQTSVQACKAVAQHVHTTQQPLLHVVHPNPCNTQQKELAERVANKGSYQALSDFSAESRRQRVLAMLEANPELKYAVVNDTDSDPVAVLVTLAIRNGATCEFEIPRARYDPFLLLDLVQRHGVTDH